jgi:hypothetical protein
MSAAGLVSGKRGRGRPPASSRELALRIIQLRRHGLSYAQIGIVLNAEQVPTPMGSCWSKSLGSCTPGGCGRSSKNWRGLADGRRQAPDLLRCYRDLRTGAPASWTPYHWPPPPPSRKRALRQPLGTTATLSR